MALKVAMMAELSEPGEVIDGSVQAVTSYLVRALGAMPREELHVMRLWLDMAERIVAASGMDTQYASDRSSNSGP